MLELLEVSVSFGGVRAVDRCTFEVLPGSITGLVGPNGAGKTTVFNLISGFVRPSAGEIRCDGSRIDGLPPHEIARRGVVRTFQLPKAAPNMTVLESLMLAAPNQCGDRLSNVWFRPARVARQERELIARARETLAFLNLDRLAREFAAHLSVGQKKLLEIGRGLMAEPRLLLLDEPGAGVNPALTLQIADRIEALRRQGMTILLIEHNMALISRLCTTVLVMSEGKLLSQGTPQQVQNDPEVIAAYLGGDVA